MEIVNRDRSAPFVTKDGSQIRSILDRTNSTARQQSLAEATLPPGGCTERHRHRATEELYYVLRGRGVMTVGIETRAVGRGDGILIPPGAPHTIRNTGRAPLVFLCCCAPPYSHGDTVLIPESRAREEADSRRAAEARRRTPVAPSVARPRRGVGGSARQTRPGSRLISTQAAQKGPYARRRA